ncbi:MAG: RNA polymerase sigma-70 factor [Tannerellaceae bacterium]|jgi:RNA polymerase sigma-70 factor (ECF subfamily)|nr:RNA polymerase sigma-70 factor [Tannerellaceae bacterium]
MQESQLLIGLKQGNTEIFSFLFKTYYKDLVMFGSTYLPDRSVCEDIVQSVFLKLWDEREHLTIETSLKSYLLTAVRNSCLDEIRHRHIVHGHESYILSLHQEDTIDTEHYVLYSDLHHHLLEALSKLPDSYREAFGMNRFEGLKYREIAARLKVSERTVEVRIAKALLLLRQYLKDFLEMLLLLLIFG